MPKKILLVDDEPSITEALEVILLERGYAVDIANDGKVALEAYHSSVKKRPYDLILLDIIMPKMSGMQVLDAIREEEKSRKVASDERVPIIMLSALKESWMDDAFKDGCNDYIVKPYDIDFLLMKIKDKIGE